MLPRSDGASLSGRETLCAHSGKGALPVSNQKHDWATQEAQGRSARAREEGRDSERVLLQRKHLAQGQPNVLLVSGASHPSAPKQGDLKHAMVTRGVSLLSQRRRSRVHRVRCCVQDIESFDGGFKFGVEGLAAWV